MLTCQEVSRAIASDELATAGWRRRLSIRLHLQMCRHCRRYARQIQAIGRAMQRTLGKDRLDADSRERLRKSILEQLPPAGSGETDPNV